MTPESGTVLTTASGTRYHARRECEGLATAAGVYEIGLREAVAEGLQPCQVCHPPSLNEPDARARAWRLAYQEWANANPRMPDGERVFANRVLPYVAGLSPDEVIPQYAVKTPDMTYVVDFAIRPGDCRLVVEVDGYAKGGTAPTPDQVSAANHRDHAIAAQGWTVLHFPNARVHNESTTCARELEDYLARLQTARPAPAPPPVPAPPPAPVSLPPPAPVAAPQAAPTPPPDPAPALAAGTPPLTATVASRSHRRRLLWVGVTAACVLAALLAAVLLLGRSSDKYPCPDGLSVKGNRSASGEMIYHLPGSRFYDSTAPEQCFATEGAAVQAGYRPSQAG